MPHVAAGCTRPAMTLFLAIRTDLPMGLTLNDDLNVIAKRHA